jgi:hypothetical protein
MTGGALTGAELVFPASLDDILPTLRAFEERPNSGHTPVFAKIEPLLVALVREVSFFDGVIPAPRTVLPLMARTYPRPSVKTQCDVVGFTRHDVKKNRFLLHDQEKKSHF